MRILRSTILFISLILIWFRLPAQENISLLDRKITCNSDTSSVERIIEKIVDDNDLYFSYNPDILPTQRFSFNLSGVSLEEVLHKMLPADQYKIEIIDNQIIITLNEKTPVRFSGRIVETKDGSPIPYASLNVEGETIGTMTNVDGRFDFIIPERFQDKGINISCLGYESKSIHPKELKNTTLIRLEPAIIHLREIKVKPIDVAEVLSKFRNNIRENYELSSQLMVTFYRETIKRDNQYIGMWEAVMEMLKSPYTYGGSDRIRFVKGRKSNFNKTFKDLSLKIQGGPWYITTLDIVRNLESFLDPQFEHLYKYRFDIPVMYNNRLTWVIRFSRNEDVDFPCYYGKLLIDTETYALVSAEFGLDKKSLKLNGDTFIKKEPHGYLTRPEGAEYTVDYHLVDNKWQFHSARTDVIFKVKQEKGNIKTEYQSVSEILVTQQYTFPHNARFGPEGLFRADDIFSDIIGSYDAEFWGNYNVIKPDDDLSKALREVELSESHPK